MGTAAAAPKVFPSWRTNSSVIWGYVSRRSCVEAIFDLCKDQARLGGDPGQRVHGSAGHLRVELVLPDLCDANADIVRVAEPPLAEFWRPPGIWWRHRDHQVFRGQFAGGRAGLMRPGRAGCSWIDGGGSRRCALVGDNLAGKASANGWAGIVVFGCVRDVDELANIDIGIQALAAHPPAQRQGRRRHPGSGAALCRCRLCPGSILLRRQQRAAGEPGGFVGRAGQLALIRHKCAIADVLWQ